MTETANAALLEQFKNLLESNHQKLLQEFAEKQKVLLNKIQEIQTVNKVEDISLSKQIADAKIDKDFDETFGCINSEITKYCVDWRRESVRICDIVRNINKVNITIIMSPNDVT